jgi:hypothetical protein
MKIIKPLETTIIHQGSWNDGDSKKVWIYITGRIDPETKKTFFGSTRYMVRGEFQYGEKGQSCPLSRIQLNFAEDNVEASFRILGRAMEGFVNSLDLEAAIGFRNCDLAIISSSQNFLVELRNRVQKPESEQYPFTSLDPVTTLKSSSRTRLCWINADDENTILAEEKFRIDF